MYLLAIDIRCLFLLSWLIAVSAEASSRVVATFRSGSSVNNVLVANDKVYVGAVNRLYSLHATNLSLIDEAVTGPVLDSPLCNPELTSCIGPRSSIVDTDNYNKILQVLPGTDGIIACGSVRQGICEIRDAGNLRRTIRNSTVPVAANSANASTVSLLGKDSERIYVAATYSYDTPYREGFPAIATRLTSTLLPINSGSIEGEAAVYIRAEYRTRFRVEYIAAFLDEHYAYFATVQNKYVQAPSIANPTVSRLVRVCQNDEKYVSYSEIEIQCRGEDNANFNVLKALVRVDEELIGIFTDSEGRRSAICIFHLPKIRLTFWYNIDRCRGGTDTIGLPHIGRDSKCFNKSHLPLAEDTCQLGVGGAIEASQVAAVQYKDRVLRCLDARVVNEHTLVLLGTDAGEIMQMELVGEHTRNLQKYNEFVSGPDAVMKLLFVDDKNYLAINGKEVLSVSTTVCGEETSCDACLANRDPLCGWCLLDGKCTSQAQCQTSILGKCPRLSGAVDPRNISVSASASKSVFVPVADLPEPTDQQLYECYFGAFKSFGNWSHTGITCGLPDERPRITNSQTGTSDYANVELSVRSKSSRNNIVSHTFTFFDCSMHSICTSCATSKWNCQWCSADRKCRNADAICESSTGSHECARISGKGPEILVADSSNTSVAFTVLNMNDDAESGANSESSEAGLFCVITPDLPDESFRGRKLRVPAVLRDGEVGCSPAKLSYTPSIPRQNYSLELTRGNDVIDKTTVTVYKCQEMASDCSQCLSLDPKWRCVWCDGGCHYHEQCLKIPDKPRADALCTQPVILSFAPQSGPEEGGTVVEIRGRDLGSRIQDVQGRVFVAGSKCHVTDYQISVRILCVLDKGTAAGPVRVTIGKTGKRSVESSTMFHFRSPTPKSVYPVFGPASGGTQLSIYGDNLHVGSNVSVHLDNLPCQVLPEARSNEHIICLTSPSSRMYTVTAMRVQIDNAVRLFNAKFTYRADPTVASVEPTTAFESGGRLLVVTGSNFDAVLSAKMYLLAGVDSPTEVVSELGDCQIHNSSNMHCRSPRLLLPATHRRSTYARWPVGFVMDGVRAVQTLGYRVQLTTVPDPQFSPFKGVKMQLPDQPLIIRGNYLSQAATIDEYMITVGTERCQVFMLEAHEVLCRLPDVQPSATDDAGVELSDGRPLVVVHVGALRAELGMLEYDSSGNDLFRMNNMRLVLIALSAIGVLGAVTLLVFLLWRRRSSEHERVYKRIQMQLEQMECSVRNECKQAFAELQTDILTDLKATIDDTGIPYHDRAEFVSRLLFRDSTDASILNGYGGGGMSIYSSQLPMALAQFDSLLWNRQFLVVLVQMAESDQSISTSERSTLSSLLIVALSRNMVYCTDVILLLLSQHIERNANGKHPHLLFRRSESLVEKLFQHWLTICLFSYLQSATGPGRNFFVLYKALKCQIEKGPVDSVTGNARYSLSEQNLLREPVEAELVTLLVIPADGFDQAPVTCKVLDCDTISQVKSKLIDLLYRNQPLSTRIATDQFDLEWKCPRRGCILLLDDDRPQVKGQKKLNTVVYYGIPNNALLTMQTRSSHSYTFRSGSSDTTCSAWSSAHLIETSTSPLSCHDTQYYHLTPPATSHPTTDKRRRQQDTEESSAGVMRNLPEVYLTRLLMCKGTVQQFVESFFDSVTFSDSCEAVPLILKYVLDMLDQEASRNGITDPEVIHSWKTNAVVLRFWMQLIHNPDCLFDVQRQHYLDSSFVVIGQTMIDAFSRSGIPLGKESPSSKLLFAKEISRYRPVAAEMFHRVQQMPPISDKVFYEHISSLSKSFGEGMSSTTAVGELLNWVKANGLRLVDMLDQDPVSVKQRLGERLRQIVHCSIVEPEHIYATLR